MSAPRLNPLAPPALLGLTYRALAGDADPDAAALTQRRLEQLQERATELLKAASSLKMDVEIAGARVLELKHDAHQAELDLQLFEQRFPPLPQQRGLLGPRLTQQQRETEGERAKLVSLLDRRRSEVAETEQRLESRSKELERVDHEQRQVHVERATLAGRLQEQLAARVLRLLAAGQVEDAAYVLAGARRTVRGDLMVAALLVLVNLFGEGTASARAALAELKPIFGQHHDAIPRVLRGLGTLAAGGQLALSELAAFTAESFATPAFYRLYQLVRALAGWSIEPQRLETDRLARTLELVQVLVRLQEAPAEASPPDAARIVAQAVSGDLVDRALAAHALLLLGSTRLIPAAAGVDIAAIQPPRRKRDRWPRLWDMLADAPRAWPQALVEQWTAVLACHVLLSARELAAPELCAAWLSESYDWPKSDFYWWVLAEVKGDRSLLANLKHEAGELVQVAPV